MTRLFKNEYISGKLKLEPPMDPPMGPEMLCILSNRFIPVL